MPLSLPPNPYRLQSVNAKRGIIAQFFYANGNVDLFFRSKSAAAKKCRRQKKRVALQRTGWTEYCGRFVGDKTQASVTPCHMRSEEHTSELQSRGHLVCRLLLETKK